MAKQKNFTGVVTISAVDYSSQISSCVVTPNVEELDTTAFGDTARRREGGLTDGSVSLTFKLNEDLTNYVTINGLLGTVVAITYKADNGAIAAGNPELQFNVHVNSGIPLGGDVGSLIEQSVTWPMDTGVTYDVVP